LAEQSASERLARTIDDDVVMLGDGAQLKRVANGELRAARAKARMPVLADNDVVVHEDTKRGGGMVRDSALLECRVENKQISKSVIELRGGDDWERLQQG
jgi:hypothetical protein